MAERAQIKDVIGTGSVSTPMATPIDAFMGAPQVAPNSGLSQLAQALSKGADRLITAGQKDAKKKKKEKDLEDKARLSSIAAEIRKEQKTGVISKVRVGELHPDLSVTNQVLLTQMLASTDTAKSWNTIFEDFNKNPYDAMGENRINNKVKLDSWVEGQRNDIRKLYEYQDKDTGEMKVHDFAYAGALNKFNQMLASHETNWSNQRRENNTKITTDYLEQEVDGNVRKTLNSPDNNGNYNFAQMYEDIENAQFKDDKGQPLMVLDPDVIDDTVFTSIVASAEFMTTVDKNGLVQGIALLDSIPKRLREKGGNEGIILAMKAKMNDKASNNMLKKMRMDEHLKTVGLKNAKAELYTMFDGTFDGTAEKNKPLKYNKDNWQKAADAYIAQAPILQRAELKTFLMTINDYDQTTVNPSKSLQNKLLLANKIMTFSTSNNLEEVLFKADTDKTSYKNGTTNEKMSMLMAKVEDMINSNDLSLKDGMEVFKNLEKYMEGSDILADPLIDSTFNETVGQTIQANMKAVTGTLDQIKGTKFYSQLKQVYLKVVRTSVMNSINDKGVVPQQEDFLDILDKSVLLSLSRMGLTDTDGMLSSEKLDNVIKIELGIAVKPLSDKNKPVELTGE